MAVFRGIGPARNPTARPLSTRSEPRNAANRAGDRFSIRSVSDIDIAPEDPRLPALARIARERLPDIAVLFTSGYKDDAAALLTAVATASGARLPDSEKETPVG